LNYQREKVTDSLIDEIRPLLSLHWKEVGHEDVALDPDFEAYGRCEEAGLIRVFTARNDAGLLVGYCIFFVRPHLHHKRSLQASQDLLYLDLSYRGLKHGGELIAFCDEALAKEGVEVVYQHSKVQHDFGPLLEKLGYKKSETIYRKRLKNG
jgi:GNAT superfamily N-acetyltransferase